MPVRVRGEGEQDLARQIVIRRLQSNAMGPHNSARGRGSLSARLASPQRLGRGPRVMTLLDSAKALLFGAEPSTEVADPRLAGVEIPTIDPYDHAAVKRTLDDGIVHVRRLAARSCGGTRCGRDGTKLRSPR